MLHVYRNKLTSMRMTGLTIGLISACLSAAPLAHADDAAILNPGAPVYAVQTGQAHFGNAAIEAAWVVAQNRLSDLTVTDRDNGQVLKVDALFDLTLPNKQSIKASDMHLLAAPSEHALAADPKSPNLAERSAGKAVSASFGDADGRFRVDWQLVQREGSAYLREIVTVTALKQDEPLTSVSLIPSTIECGSRRHRQRFAGGSRAAVHGV
jgi:hypothetical protein